MARVTHTAVTALGPNPTAGAVLTVTAADATLFEQTAHTGKEIVIARNTGAGARTVTIESATDERGRLGDITAQSLAAGAVVVFGPFDVTGWRQTNGMLFFRASHAEITFSVIRLP